MFLILYYTKKSWCLINIWRAQNYFSWISLRTHMEILYHQSTYWKFANYFYFFYFFLCFYFSFYKCNQVILFLLEWCSVKEITPTSKKKKKKKKKKGKKNKNRKKKKCIWTEFNFFFYFFLEKIPHKLISINTSFDHSENKEIFQMYFAIKCIHN